MRADLDEAERKYAIACIVTPTPACYRGIACILAGEPGRADAFFQEAVSVARQTDAQEILVGALGKRSLLAMARGDWSQAEDLADQARAAFRRPGIEEELGIWVAQARVAEGSSPVTASSLTAAELRLLPLLSTHLSAPEIAGELFLSPHTIKSQMRSTYRKLGVSSRNQAITRARELGLLEG
jgi:LuxR family maltose regulon positive regulatory protein